jgi:DNA-binding Lrp family transcriptional regulator
LPIFIVEEIEEKYDGGILKLKIDLDETDRKILKVIEEQGGNLPTAEFSKILNIPARTIRYRINKMKEKKFILEPMVQTYERKLGMGEKLLILQSYPDKEELLSKILDASSIFYYFAPTYGRYDGFVVYTMYPLVRPNIIRDLAEELKALDVIRDYFIFDLVDYKRQPIQISSFIGESRFSWDKWSEDAEKVMKSGCKLKVELEEFPSQVPFDYEDVKIITHMVENPTSTLKEIADHSSLSLAQVHKRVKRLEDTGIIRENKKCLHPFEDSIMIYAIFRSREKAKNILCAFSKLPFQMTFSIENSIQYMVMLSLPSSEVTQFLQRVTFLKRHSEEFFVQVVLEGTSKGFVHLLKAYNEENDSWELPDKDPFESIRTLVS